MTIEQATRREYWKSELESLGIEPHGISELNDTRELESLTDCIKQVYYQDYKTAYSKDSEGIEESHFEHMI